MNKKEAKILRDWFAESIICKNEICSLCRPMKITFKEMLTKLKQEV